MTSGAAEHDLDAPATPSPGVDAPDSMEAVRRPVDRRFLTQVTDEELPRYAEALQRLG